MTRNESLERAKQQTLDRLARALLIAQSCVMTLECELDDVEQADADWRRASDAGAIVTAASALAAALGINP